MSLICFVYTLENPAYFGLEFGMPTSMSSP